MTPDRSEKIAEVLERALSLSAAERDRYLNEACGIDHDLRHEVESLLLAHERAGDRFLNTAANEGAAPNGAPVRVGPGTRIGPYVVESEIGHGGMGEVFCAVRADGQYEQRVAIKLVRSGYGSAAILERFRNERQILAGLDHPNIARLLDGGTASDGVPYLVMELVAGAPIDSYCDAKQLTIAERLHLFRKVCAAVQYAHQRLVVHRDLKPSNILVTTEGVPKLLDFGIAKLIDPATISEATSLRPMTPEYASPEQTRGEPITTASDVYSLGVILYLLITGHSPYRLTIRTPAELARAINEVDPENPSTAVSKAEQGLRDGVGVEPTPDSVSRTREGTPLRLQRKLRGDIDFIVLKALRKEPQQRYASAEQFAEDIRRHLEGLPVLARKGTWSYKTGKFVKRHKTGMAAAALVVLAISAGVIATVREARIAQRRFNDVRKLANSLMFEVHDSIENIPGSTQARKLILQRSLEYLDKLRNDSGNDPELLRELATAYRRIGMAQGNPRDPNLGDTKGALASFKKSIEMREALAYRNPRDSGDQVQLAIAYLDFSDFQNGTGQNLSSAFEYTKRGLALLERQVTANPKNVLVLTQTFRAHTNLAMMEIGEGTTGKIGTNADAIADLQKAIELAHQVLALAPNALDVAGQEGIANGLLGETYLSAGDRPQAIAYYQRALEILQELAKKQDKNIRLLYNESVLEGKIGNALLIEGNNAEAIPHFVRAQETPARFSALDPSNQQMQEGKINSTAELGYALSESGRDSEGIQYLRQAIKESEAQPEQNPAVQVVQGIFRTWLGQALEHQRQMRESSQEYAAGKRLLGAARAAGSDDRQTTVAFCSAANRLGAALVAVGHAGEATQEYDESLRLLEPLYRANPADQEVLYALAETYTRKGALSMKRAQSARARPEQLAGWQASREWFQKSLAVWDKVAHPARLTADGIEVTLPSEVSRRLESCKTMIAFLSNAGPE